MDTIRFGAKERDFRLPSRSVEAVLETLDKPATPDPALLELPSSAERYLNCEPEKQRIEVSRLVPTQ